MHPGRGQGAGRGETSWRVYDRAQQLVAIVPSDAGRIRLTDVPTDVGLLFVAESNGYGTADPVALAVP